MQKLDLIYLIDDSRAINQSNKALLESLEVAHSIVLFSSAEKALAALHVREKENRLPDVLFLDLSMPDIDGFGFLDQYIQLPFVQSGKFPIKIIVLSSYMDFKNLDKVELYKKFGVVGNISKPLIENDVLEFLAKNI